MKKIILNIVTVMLLATTPLAAQHYKEDYQIDRTKKGDINTAPGVEMVYGLMTGVNIPIMRDKHHDIKSEGSAGFMLGARWGVDLGGFEIVPEFWYYHDMMTLNNPDQGVKADLKSDSFEIPIVFGIDLGKRLKFNFGPSFSLASSAELEYEGETFEFGRYQSTFGYFVGMSYTVMNHWVADVRYSGRFVSSENQWPGSDTQYDYRYYGVSIAVGYRF